MGDTASASSDVAYIAMTEDDNSFRLYICMQNATALNESVDAKLARGTKVGAASTKGRLRKYLSTIVPEIARLLNVTLVTDLQQDNLLQISN